MRWSVRQSLNAAAILLALGGAALWFHAWADASHENAARTTRSKTNRAALDALPHASRTVHRASSAGFTWSGRLVDRDLVLGTSSLGRPIRGEELGNPLSPIKVLVVGCIHGNECSGIAIAEALAKEAPPENADVWIVFDLNPDGLAANTRQNGRGVDLNRNFPNGWRPLGPPGSTYYAGPTPASEPETRIALSLIDRTRPTISIWFHQHLDLVDESGGSLYVERRYAQLVNLPLRQLPRYPGSVVTWEDHQYPGTTAFVVELPAGSLSVGNAERFADAILSLVNVRS